MSKQIVPVIFGLSSTTINDEERCFFCDVNPEGFILFKRNIANPDQLRALIEDLKTMSGRDCSILIDQEGGRVARLKPPYWPEFPPMSKFAELAKQDLVQAAQATYDNGYAIGKQLKQLGFNIDCAPVADLLIDGAHDIVGDRSFGSDPEQVAMLARKMAEGLLDAGVSPVIKHIPGHGRAMVDSHEALPIVTASIDVLEESDFKVFQLLNDMPYAMTAHIVYSALDADNPATLSEKVIDYIKEDIGFTGKIISDDVTMKAVSSIFAADKTGLCRKKLFSLCDIILHCNGVLADMQNFMDF